MLRLAAYEYNRNKTYMKTTRRILRDNLDPFDMPDDRFTEMYRFPRCLALDFLDLIHPFVQSINECPSIPMTTQFCSVLHFYASGSYQRRVGSDAFAMMRQSLVSRCVASFSYVIATKIMDRFIQFPHHVAEVKKLHNDLQQHSDFPGAFGIVDGSHIGLAAVAHEIEHAYVNRKKFYSINAQFVVDVRMRILSVNARYPGSTHDSLVWRASLVNSSLREMANRMGQSWTYFLLADNGYPLQPWIINPYDSPNTRAEKLYNVHHRKLRSLVERVIGILKARFRCLLRERKLRYDPLKSGFIIYSCAVLHNYLIANNHPVDDIDPIFDEEIESFDEIFEISYDELQRGKQIRNNIAQYFVNS